MAKLYCVKQDLVKQVYHVYLKNPLYLHAAIVFYILFYILFLFYECFHHPCGSMYPPAEY